MNRTLKVHVGDNYYLVDPNTAQAHAIYGPVERLQLPHFRQQEIAFDDPNSECFFRTDDEKPLVITPKARARFGDTVIQMCLAIVQAEAVRYEGLDYLQVFEDGSDSKLWIKENFDGQVMALLPSDD